VKELKHKDLSSCSNGYDRECEAESNPSSHKLNKRSEGKSQPSAAGSASEGDSTDSGMKNIMPKE
jgi:hypothetical protein